MHYISTRGKAPALGFEDVLLTGLASDGGLYVPAALPRYSADEIAAWRGLSYPELALRNIEPFVGGAVPAGGLKAIIHAKRLIITNSTFSYWGGYIGDVLNPGRQVIAP